MKKWTISYHFKWGTIHLLSIVFIEIAIMVYSVVQAQIPGLHKGDLVRISSSLFDNQPFLGRIGNFYMGSIDVLYNGGTMNFPYNSIDKLEVARGRKSHPLKGAVIGLGGGVILGGIIGAAAYKPCTSTELFGCLLAPANQANAVMTGALVGGVLCGLSGLIVGAVSHSTRWKSIVVPPAVSIGVIPVQLNNGNYHPLLNVRFSLNSR